MILQLLVTTVAMLALMAGYYFVQNSLRHVSPEMGEDYDPLEDRWGCGGE